jgi:hypothetical protein
LRSVKRLGLASSHLLISANRNDRIRHVGTTANRELADSGWQSGRSEGKFSKTNPMRNPDSLPLEVAKQAFLLPPPSGSELWPITISGGPNMPGLSDLLASQRCSQGSSRDACCKSVSTRVPLKVVNVQEQAAIEARTTASLETTLTPLNQRFSVLPVPIASFGRRANTGPLRIPSRYFQGLTVPPVPPKVFKVRSIVGSNPTLSAIFSTSYGLRNHAEITGY